MTDNELRLALESFQFDTGRPSLTFGKRLARENGWSSEHSRAAIEEYLRFVYLCTISREPLTPSDAVDQVWHLHLSYTRSYWDDLCDRILGRALHHGPTRGGAEEQSKYAEWYARTLALYERVYGRQPRRDIWPDVAARFANADAFRRVDTAAHWVISKKHVQAAGIGACLCAVAVPAYAQNGALTAFTVATLVVGALVLIGYFISRTVRADRRPPKKQDSGAAAAGGGAYSSKHSDTTDAGDGAASGSGCGGGGCGGGGCGGG